MATIQSFTDELLPKEFLALPGLVYKSDPYWLPEDQESLEYAFHPAQDFFLQGSAEIFFIPKKARIAVFFHPSQHKENKKIAYFGYWETVNKLDLNKTLFAQAESWAREQGADIIYGPINFNTYGLYRLQLNGFDVAPFPGEPHNPAYYPGILEKCGYAPMLSYYSQICSKDYLTHLAHEKSNLPDPTKSIPYRLENLTMELWSDQISNFYQLVDRIFSDNFAYSPISEENFRRLYGQDFAKKLCPITSFVAYDKNDNKVGFCFAFPDYSPLCRHGANPRLQYKKINYQEHFQLLRNPTVLVKTVGVDPDHRRTGILNSIGIRIVQRSLSHYNSLVHCLMSEFNYQNLMNWQGGNDSAMAPDQVRRYGLYSKVL